MKRGSLPTKKRNLVKKYMDKFHRAKVVSNKRRYIRRPKPRHEDDDYGE